MLILLVGTDKNSVLCNVTFVVNPCEGSVIVQIKLSAAVLIENFIGIGGVVCKGAFRMERVGILDRSLAVIRSRDGPDGFLRSAAAPQNVD